MYLYDVVVVVVIMMSLVYRLAVYLFVISSRCLQEGERIVWHEEAQCVVQNQVSDLLS